MFSKMYLCKYFNKPYTIFERIEVENSDLQIASVAGLTPLRKRKFRFAQAQTVQHTVKFLPGRNTLVVIV